MNKMNTFRKKRKKAPPARLRYPLERGISLVGLMGSGKTTVGRRLARKLGLEFVDSDAEIELAADYSIPEIFEKFGEKYFRDGERKVIERLSSGKKRVLGTGGGAFMDPVTRKQLLAKTITIWLKVDINLLVERTSRRNTRPLLRQGNPADTLKKLAKERYPVYEQAHIIVESKNGSHDTVVRDIVHKLNSFLALEKKQKREKIKSLS